VYGAFLLLMVLQRLLLLLALLQAIAQQQHRQLLSSARLDGEHWQCVAGKVLRRQQATGAWPLDAAKVAMGASACNSNRPRVAHSRALFGRLAAWPLAAALL
jgi:hypothetical protein